MKRLRAQADDASAQAPPQLAQGALPPPQARSPPPAHQLRPTNTDSLAEFLPAPAEMIRYAQCLCAGRCCALLMLLAPLLLCAPGAQAAR